MVCAFARSLDWPSWPVWLGSLCGSQLLLPDLAHRLWSGHERGDVCFNARLSGGCGTEKRIAELDLFARNFKEQLNLNSSNSWIPPSANPLNAPKPVNKRATGRKPGGRPDIPGIFVVVFRPSGSTRS